MKEFCDKVVSELLELYYLYESYIWKWDNQNVNINIIFANNSIYFDLGILEEGIDSYGVAFDEKDRKLYKYISIKFLVKLLGCMVIHHDNDMFFNDNHKPYLSVFIEDEELLGLMEKVALIQKNDFVNERMDLVTNLYKEIPFKIYSSSIFESIEKRKDMSRYTLRRIKL